MAWSLPTKVLKNIVSKTRVRTLVCVICEEVYHTGHFEQINGAIKLSEQLIICQEHPDLHNINITSKFDHVQLSEEVKILIAQTKLESQFKAKQDILKEIEDDTQKTLNKTAIY